MQLPMIAAVTHTDAAQRSARGQRHPRCTRLNRHGEIQRRMLMPAKVSRRRAAKRTGQVASAVTKLCHRVKKVCYLAFTRATTPRPHCDARPTGNHQGTSFLLAQRLQGRCDAANKLAFYIEGFLLAQRLQGRCDVTRWKYLKIKAFLLAQRLQGRCDRGLTNKTNCAKDSTRATTPRPLRQPMHVDH